MMRHEVEFGFDNHVYGLNKAHEDDAGYDLVASESRNLFAGQRLLVPTAVRVAIPKGCVGLVCSRSGLARHDGVVVLNAPGIIDSGYRGQIGVVLVNHGEHVKAIQAGDRIAQLVVIPLMTTPSELVDHLNDETERGANGFGSSGTTNRLH